MLDMPSLSPRRGVWYALISSLVCGLAIPVFKGRFGGADPFQVSACLNLGIVLAMTLLSPWRLGMLSRGGWFYFVGAIVAGIAAPVLLFWGLSRAPGSVGSLLLNLDPVFTALIAWVCFCDRLGRRSVLGFILVIVGSLLVSIKTGGEEGVCGLLAVLALAASCFCFAISNNCMAQLREIRAAALAFWLGLFIGGALFALYAVCGGRFGDPMGWRLAGESTLLGVTQGLALIGYIVSLRLLGTGRTSAYFATVPFIGAVACVVFLGEPVTSYLLVAAVLMIAGVWALLSESLESHSPQRSQKVQREELAGNQER